MNNYFEKIADLLEKKKLTKEEKSLLDTLLNDDPEAMKFFKTYTEIEKTLERQHLGLEELRDYVLIKNGSEPENNEILKRLPGIEKHLRSCSKCSEEFRFLNNEYREVETFLAGEMHSEQVKAGSVKTETAPASPKRNYSRYYYSIAASAALVYVILLFISNAATPEMHRYAAISDKSDFYLHFYITRGKATDEFQQSIRALEEEDYESAILHLKKDIELNPEDKTIFYSYYIIGLSYLETAENSFMGLFPAYNKLKAKNALENFRMCIENNKSGRFPDITYNSFYYSAKACLMLNDVDTARMYLRKVIEAKGSKMSEAENLLKELEQNV
jgi:tetratricopeptide (TPR) repeat protein